jgi:flagellar biogenesis protein FliO
MNPLKSLLMRKRILVALGVLAGTLVLLSLLSPVATGQSGTRGATETEAASPAESPEEVPNPGIGMMAFKILGTVLLLIGILYAGVYGMRMLSGRTGRGGLGSGAIWVLHKTHIAPKKAIYVVKVGSKAMVVGVTDSQINHLCDLSEEELSSLEAPQKSKAKGFKQQLLNLATGGKERP